MAQYNRLLAFDYGTKRIGSAYGQNITSQAKALKPITNSPQGPNWKDINKLVAEWSPQAMIVGLPLNMDGTEQTITELTRQFAKQLKERFKLPVFLYDERLSTAAAKEHLFSKGGYRALQKYSIDSTAAKIILERWLGENH